MEAAPNTRNLKSLKFEFAQLLRLMRMKKGLTVSQLAKKIGCSAAFVSMLQTGRRCFSGATYMRLIGALQIDGDEAFTAFKTAASDILVFRARFGRNQEPMIPRVPSVAKVMLLNWRERNLVQGSEVYKQQLAEEILAWKPQFPVRPPMAVNDADRGEPPVFDNAPAPVPNWLAY